MTIPSIKMTESRAGDVGATGAAVALAGPDSNAGSFASLLGEEAGNPTGAPESIPAMGMTADVATAHWRAETVEQTSIPEQGAARPPVQDPHGLTEHSRANGPVRAGDRVRGNSVGTTKNGGSGKGKPEGAAGLKRSPEAPVVQGATGVVVPAPVLPVDGDAALAAPASTKPKPLMQDDDRIDVSVPDQISGPERMVEVGGVAGPHAAAADSDDVSTADMQVAAMTQTAQPLDAASSSIKVTQTVQGQPDVWSDTVQALLPQAPAAAFLQETAHVVPQAADKASRPADSNATTLDSRLVVEPAQGDVNQHTFDASRGNIAGSMPVEVDHGDASANLGPAPNNGSGAKKSDGRQEHDGLSASPVGSNSSRVGATGTAGAGTFGMTLSRQLHSTTVEGDLRRNVSDSFALSASEQFAMERRQTMGATRALGDALQSTAGLGVQTDSFGRVTIHTATEGNHLLAQVTLEDGRQSATLVSHVPAVEQRLTQQLGLQTAVNVSTGPQSSSSGHSGDSEAPPPRRETTEMKAEKRGEDSVSVLQAVEARTRPLVGTGRIDVTV